MTEIPPPGGDHEMSEHDERDAEEQRSDPNPQPKPRVFEGPNDDPTVITMEAAPVLSASVKVDNRGLLNEGVAGGRITIGTVTATANSYGNATINLSTLEGGDVSEAPFGTSYQPNHSKARIWRSLTG